MSIFSALRRSNRSALPGHALYQGIVAIARRPAWYLSGEVPDTIDGRFDMVALVLSLLLIRLQDEGNDASAQLSADVTERFISDMDGSLRQDGIGDQVVGKHVGRMMAALGGRLGAYRDARGDDAAFAEALRRNMWRGAAVGEDAVAWVTAEARKLAGWFDTLPLAKIEAGEIGA